MLRNFGLDCVFSPTRILWVLTSPSGWSIIWCGYGNSATTGILIVISGISFKVLRWIYSLHSRMTILFLIWSRLVIKLVEAPLRVTGMLTSCFRLLNLQVGTSHFPLCTHVPWHITMGWGEIDILSPIFWLSPFNIFSYISSRCMSY